MSEIDISQLEADSKEQEKVVQEKAILSLNDLTKMAEQLVALEHEVEALNDQLRLKTEEYNRLSQQIIPEAMLSIGLKQLTLANGREIVIKEMINVGIKEDVRAKAHAWLRDHGFGDIIKNQVAVLFGKNEDEYAKKLQETITAMEQSGEIHFGEMNVHESVHHSTLKAFVTERLRSGEAVPADLFGLNVVQVAKLLQPAKRRLI